MQIVDNNATIIWRCRVSTGGTLPVDVYTSSDRVLYPVFILDRERTSKRSEVLMRMCRIKGKVDGGRALGLGIYIGP